MKLHDASKKELRRVSLGSVICLGAMLALFFMAGRLDHRAILAGVLGTGVALWNFAALCLSIQRAAAIEEPKQRRTGLQLSYHLRLLGQGAWVLAAFSVPWLQPVAAALPLLFPSAVIFVLRRKE